ncbi:S41 family peptidase [Phaeodactylibacter luteus]|uniref:S41 family peptidase n=1 Tax=Phaeodactylibacter luteus TaxID=1564516 RepID=A0A5C6RIB5_9BACT|nr:S41 family peptidase [Phaeodactylibacter luteus]TXB60094.1 S41 family peptidase [Phaeodactylibacter luteus]
MQQDNTSKSHKLSVWFPLMFAIVLVIGMLIGMRMQTAAPALAVEQETTTDGLGQGKVEEILRYVEAKYVDPVDRDALLQEVIDDLLGRLDPHSNYISAEDLREVNEQLEGNFDGIGVEFMMLDDTIVVVAPLAGGPSEAAGILAGDKIIQIADSTIAGVNMSTSGIIELLRGEKGTAVEVGVLRRGETALREYTITRDEIPMNSVDASYMLNDKVGYIKLNRFSATTYEEFMKGLEEMVEKEGMEDLVIDLRHNPGGYLQQATSILSQLFRRKDQLLVFTEGRSVSRNDYTSTGRAFFDVDDIVVLIDEGSASASEILAGAIQDHDRGTVIGRRSFGKGLVQEQYKLKDGSALRLTVARYYTPSGRSIQKPYDDPEAYDKEMYDRYETGELESEARMVIQDSTAYYTDNGRVVYGGGGIMPDIFVPIDSLATHELYLELRQYVPEFVFRHISGEGQPLTELSLEAFDRTFQVEPELVADFLSFARSKDDGIAAMIPPFLQAEVRHMLKARIAKHLFDNKGYYYIWNQRDDMVNAALKVLTSPNPQTASQQ